MSKVIGSDLFENEVLKSGTPVLVDFFATWCGPCKMIAPALEEISAEMQGVVKVIKVDIDASVDLARKYDVRSVPTLMIFKGGEPVDRIIGAYPKDMIVERIETVK